MENEIKVVSRVRRVGNGRAKFNRIIINLFRLLTGMEPKLPGVEELSVDGIFARMQKDKEKLVEILVKQDEAIALREVAAQKTIEKADNEVKRLMDQIEDAKKVLQATLAEGEIDKAAIAAEKERVQRVSQRMSEFFA